MRVIVCPHDTGMGGSQINAIDLAAAVRQRGHDVMLYAPPGPLLDRVRALDLDWTASPPGLRLSAAWTIGLVRLARSWHADLVHTYEWAPSVGAAFGPHGLLGTAQVMTVLSMDVPDFLPRHLDLVVGTQQLGADSGRFQHRHVIEPPVDTQQDAPRDRAQQRHLLGLDPDAFVVSLVGRLTTDLDKVAGVLAAIEAVDEMAAERHVVLVVAGDGPELVRVADAAGRVNTRHDRTVVEMTGSLVDPRPVYAAADVVLGMGSSILRAMAFARPCIVLGASGFCLPVTRRTIEAFTWQGFYGVDDGSGYRGLLGFLERLAASPEDRQIIGIWSRGVVVDRYSLGHAAEVLTGVYSEALARRGSSWGGAASLLESAAGVGSYMVHRVLPRRAVA
ncbi:Glycosyltransferase involved in cell wall bisynthesis [Raineyella antarctica]|uniref:Glycosyltransferase involved in cell wall bisynthesis n=1 Tax=Raineyella antarctica TaxID=1577474 RepID=A0A1G6HHM6_9ACTN|nr:glycosyltransferase [Raineyella antarctica]SDB93445.1 Glycosyltransferase involved in cell wall bisynthesis [Raineyella antarctica]